MELLTKMSHEVPKVQDRPNRSQNDIVYRPCDCIRHLSQLLHGILDIPVYKHSQQARFLGSAKI